MEISFQIDQGKLNYCLVEGGTIGLPAEVSFAVVSAAGAIAGIESALTIVSAAGFLSAPFPQDVRAPTVRIAANNKNDNFLISSKFWV